MEKQKPMNTNEEFLIKLIINIFILIITGTITPLISVINSAIINPLITTYQETSSNSLSNSLAETIQTIVIFVQIGFSVIAVFVFIHILLILHERSNSKDEATNKTQSNNQHKHSPITKKDNGNKEKSNLTIKLDLPNSTIFRPNVDKILSMIQYVEDLQKKIKNDNNKKQNSLLITDVLPLKLSGIDQSIFVKFNILKDNFMLDYKAIDWNNNINQEISNFYQKIYDKHHNLLQVEYDNIKNYLTDYLDHQS